MNSLLSWQQKRKKEARATKVTQKTTRGDTKKHQRVAKVIREKGKREDSLQEIHLPSIATGFTTRRVKETKELAATNTIKRSPLKRKKNCWPLALRKEVPLNHRRKQLLTPWEMMQRQRKGFATNSKSLGSAPKEMTVHTNMSRLHQREVRRTRKHPMAQ